jgi:hypothetical protein
MGNVANATDTVILNVTNAMDQGVARIAMVQEN